MDKIEVKNIFAAVFEKSVLDALLEALPKGDIKFWGTEGTVKYLKEKGADAISIVSGFDFDGRVKTLDRAVFVRILADRGKPKHLEELEKQNLEPFNLVVVNLYAPDPKIFPESMDIGGQSLIRSAIKNYKNVALAYDAESLKKVIENISQNNGATTLEFRKAHAKAASKFIAERCALEADLFDKQ